MLKISCILSGGEMGNQQPRDLLFNKFKVHRLSSVVEEYIYKVINYIWKW